MEQDLIAEYFKRDLAPAERQALKGLLRDDLQASQRFADLAAQAWAAAGLPDPKPAPRRRPLFFVLLGLGVAAGLGIVGLAGLDMLEELAHEPAAVADAGAGHGAPEIAAGHAGAKAATPPSLRARLGEAIPRSGPRLEVRAVNALGKDPAFVVLTDPGRQAAVRLWVERSAKRQFLFEGELPAGERRWEWKGMAPGRYHIRFRAGQVEISRWVLVERR